MSRSVETDVKVTKFYYLRSPLKDVLVFITNELNCKYKRKSDFNQGQIKGQGN